MEKEVSQKSQAQEVGMRLKFIPYQGEKVIKGSFRRYIMEVETPEGVVYKGGYSNS
jgi:hypothetical protein